LTERKVSHSAFVSSELEEVKPIFSFGQLKIFRRLSVPARILPELLRLNLAFWICFAFYFVFVSAGFEANFVIILVGCLLLSALLSVWICYRHLPRRLKISRDGVVIAIDLNDAHYGEFLLPWSQIKSMKIEELKNFYPQREPYLVIRTDRDLLGLPHLLSLDNVLTDNSELSLLQDVQTWAPQLALSLPESAGGQLLCPVIGLGQTELWLHEFSTSVERKRVELLQPGDKLKEGEYEVVGVLSGGGQGNTYLIAGGTGRSDSNLGCDSQQGTALVLKEYILPVYRGATVTQAITDKLYKEADILRRLQHPNIVALKDCFVDDFRGYLVLEFVDGLSLKDLVARQGPLGQVQVLAIAKQLAQALDYLHSQYPPVLHRDLSCDNVMLACDGQLKVVDFNLAQRLDVRGRSALVGKQAYMAPEQFRGQSSAASDIYSLGACLFYLLTGKEACALAVSNPALECPTLNKQLCALVEKATALEAEERFASAQEVLVALCEIKL
jgi:serine/threonine protein kinase